MSAVVTEYELREAVLGLKDSPKSGPDDLPPFFIKRFWANLHKPVIRQGIFPEAWKTSSILRIYKSGQHNDVSISSHLKYRYPGEDVRILKFLEGKIISSKHGFFKC